MSTLGVTLAEDGAAAVGLATELLMLKEIIFLVGDIFGLVISSGSTSSLFGKRRGVLHLFLALDRNSHYNAVHTPALHQRVADSAK